MGDLRSLTFGLKTESNLFLSPFFCQPFEANAPFAFPDRYHRRPFASERDRRLELSDFQLLVYHPPGV